LPPCAAYATSERALLEYVAGGSGRPTIVLLNDAGGPMEGWYKVYDALGALETVFAYNRPGIGGSDRPNDPQTGSTVVATLRALLYANLYARMFPHEMCGVVMLEAATPSDVQLHRSPLQRLVEAALNAVLGSDAHGETAHVGATAGSIESAGAFPDVPLVVVTGGRRGLPWLAPSKLHRARLHNQRALCAMSRRSKQVVAPRSGHFPQFPEPELVVQAVRDVALWDVAA
jgi:pimeloyl-ACP methyl ester carboxylesterase